VTSALPSVVIVTGTDTGVGKTVTTAALASVLAAGRTVAVYKPVQTGVDDAAPADIDEVRRLSGLTSVFDGARLRDPLAPRAAARREGVRLPGLVEHARRIDALAADYDHVLVEGVGGLLVGLDDDGHALVDLPRFLTSRAVFVIVCRAGLGTLNHTGLTVHALRARNCELVGIVIGSWPEIPDLAARSNLVDLPSTADVLLVGRIPERAAALEPAVFQELSVSWFTPPLGSWQP